MKYNNVVLILDNFRNELSEFSVDVQDVVRSAILDDIDISEYIIPCKDDPYKLEQIRLSLKQGLRVISTASGSILYKIRQLYERGIDISSLDRYEKSGVSEACLEYFLSWLEDGLNVYNINIAIIPKNLLDIFDYGIRNGYDMTPFNTGKSYTSDYIRVCLKMASNGKSIDMFTSKNWDILVLSELAGVSKKLSLVKWNDLVSNITEYMGVARIKSLIKCTKSGMPLEGLNKDINGQYVFSVEDIEYIYGAYINGYDYKSLLELDSGRDVAEAFHNMDLNSNKILGGKLRKR